MPTSSNLARRAPAEIPDQHVESQPRPKVMRRPAHFSAVPVVVEKDAPAATTPAPNVPAPLADELLRTEPTPPPLPPSHALRSWQDDARFGVAMLFIVLVVNLGLMLWLPQLQPSTATMAMQNTTPATPIPTAAANALTFYHSRIPETAAPVVHILGAPEEPGQ